MTQGQLRIRGTALGFLAVGWSYQHLWWTSLEDNAQTAPPKRRRRRDQRLISSGDLCPAHRCRACGMIAFQPTEVDDGWSSDDA